MQFSRVYFSYEYSVREICGKEDIDNAYRIFSSFFDNFSDIDKKLNVDF